MLNFSNSFILGRDLLVSKCSREELVKDTTLMFKRITTEIFINISTLRP
jgi:hypothetical protein